MKFKDKLAKTRDKFSFSIEFQNEVIRFLLQSKESMMVLKKIKPGYFALIEHSLIIEAVKKFSNKYGKVPTKPLLIEQVRRLLTSKEYVDLVTKDDISNINKNIEELYSKPLKDEDVIQNNIYQYIAYVEMKSLNENMDFSNFDNYKSYQEKVAKIIRSSEPEKEDEPLLMVGGTTRRQLLRQIDPDVIPTPSWQLNSLSNGGGYPRGSIVVFLDKAKAKKTFTLINFSRGYMAMKKNVLYIDLENGKGQIMDRMVQSTMNKSKRDMLSGQFDQKEKAHMRKYKRLGVEFIVQRLPAMVADANSIKAEIDKIRSKYGITVHVLVIDYAAKLAAISRTKDDVERINQVYIDLDNLAKDANLDIVLTAQHVTREGGKIHRQTRYEDNDIAAGISIIRNAQVVIGLNSTDEEEEHGIQRLEIVDQRDGVPHGRCLYNVDVEKQRWKEFTKEARASYDETQGKVVDELINNGSKIEKKKKVNPYADPEKAKLAKDI